MLNRKKNEKLCSFFAAPNDYLARRRTNTAPNKTPNIDISDIETNGISLEKLDILTVPVYRYQTQITIHGIWPDTIGYCLGYKHLTKNANGSVGIRYGAIDGIKKKHLRSLCQYSRFSAGHTSTDNYFYMSFRSQHKNRAVRVYEYLRKYNDLFIGNVSACYNPLTGRYYVIVDLAAIPESNMELFKLNILKVTPKKIVAVDMRNAEKQAKREAEEEVQQAEHVKQVTLAKSIATEQLLANGFNPTKPNGSDYKGFLPTYDTEYSSDYKSKTYYPAFRLIEVKRKSFGACYMSRTSRSIDDLKAVVFDWHKKSRRVTKNPNVVYV